MATARVEPILRQNSENWARIILGDDGVGQAGVEPIAGMEKSALVELVQKGSVSQRDLHFGGWTVDEGDDFSLVFVYWDSLSRRVRALKPPSYHPMTVTIPDLLPDDDSSPTNCLAALRDAAESMVDGPGFPPSLKLGAEKGPPSTSLGQNPKTPSI